MVGNDQPRGLTTFFAPPYPNKKTIFPAKKAVCPLPFHRFVSQFSRLFFFSDNLILSCPN
jgi:hypothetical protein